VSLRRMGTLLGVVAVLLGGVKLTLRAQNSDNEVVRRAKSKVQPEYPELARRMNITGTVRVQVVVAANGTVKDAKWWWASGAGGRGAGAVGSGALSRRRRRARAS